jgi:hypothetical protein
MDTHALTNGNTLIIEQDQSPFSPREDDNLGQTAFYHSRYSLGDKNQRFATGEEAANWLKTAEGKASVVVPVYLYDHSIQCISTVPFSESRGWQHASWDSGQLGFIFATPKRIRDNWNRKRISKRLKDRTREILVAEIVVLNKYLTGDMYAYKVVDSCGEIVEAVHGFYEKKDILDQFDVKVA